MDQRPRSAPGSRYRSDLRAVVGSSASAYGYTLTVWSTGSVLSHAYGLPSPPQVFSFILGAVVGFAVVGALAFGGVTAEFEAEADAWGDHNLVFPNTIGKPMNAGNFYRREFQPLLERSGLADEGFTFHSLRHTFATTLAAKGVHPSTAQTMLGHSDIRMTLAIYTHATDEMQDAATAALESAFG